MPSSLLARAAIVVPCVVLGALAAPAAAQQPPTPPPPPPAQGSDTAPPTPPTPPATPAVKVKVVPPPRLPRAAVKPPPPRPRRGQHVVEFLPGVPIASSPNFQRLDDGSSRVSVEVSSKVDVAENKAQGRLVYRFHGAVAPGGVSQLPLITGYFSTPVDRAVILQQGPDVDLVIELRRPSESVQRVIETPRGMVLQVDFPKVPGDEAPGTSPDRERARRGSKTQTLGSDSQVNNNNDD
jgi:hypothetical protein